jgi:hypothetical protein
MSWLVYGIAYSKCDLLNIEEQGPNKKKSFKYTEVQIKQF